MNTKYSSVIIKKVSRQF